MTTTENLLRTFSQINRDFRGHEFYGEELMTAPAFYDTEDVSAQEKIVIAHYFTSNSDWWIVEVNKEEGLVFCFVCLNGWIDDAEWGYSSLQEMEDLKVGHVIIERDLHWTPTKFSDIARAHR